LIYALKKIFVNNIDIEKITKVVTITIFLINFT